MNDFAEIKFQIDDRVARITLARPPLNIMNIAMMDEIGEALELCGREANLAAIVFDAADEARAFSAGVAVEDHVPSTVVRMLDSFHRIFRLLEKISVPVVAVVNGVALGGGCELVAACDLVIASERAKFGQPEIKLGVFPPVAAVVLPRIIGEKKALEMILLGETIDAAEAGRLGLVNYVVSGDELAARTEELLTKLRALSSSSLRIARRAILGDGGDFDRLLSQAENTYLHELLKTEDANEGLQSFMEKRNPAWRHR